MERVYLAVDLKSFFASVECIERKLDPLTTNLVVADFGKTNKTICLAITPSLKELGVPARPRLFEVEQIIEKLNKQKRKKLGYDFFDISFDKKDNSNPKTKIEYIVAKPRMQYYIDYSTKIYEVYTKYFSYNDIHVYSIDEVFIDITQYLKLYNIKAFDLAQLIADDILKTTGITATVGIGTNLYLAKVAMDILAKKKKKIRIATLDELSYRKKLWDYTPISDFWRVGKKTAEKLSQIGINTMGDLARQSLTNENILYDIFGINAELLIDHAWGYESCTIEHIKNYKPVNKSVSIGQVLQKPYSYDNGLIIIKEMCDTLSLDLFEKKLLTNQISLSISYSNDNFIHKSINLENYSNLNIDITNKTIELYDLIFNKSLYVKKFNLSANNILQDNGSRFYRPSLFEDKTQIIEKQKDLTKTILDIKNKFGKNSILKGTNLEKDSTLKTRNEQIGGHSE